MAQALFEAVGGGLLAPCEVRVLRRLRLLLGSGAPGGGRVQPRQFTGDGLQRRPVDRDVMERQQHGVVLRAVPQDQGARKGAGGEIEGAACLLGQQGAGAVRVRVHDAERDRLRSRQHFLVRLTVVLPVTGTQNLVAAYQRRQRGGQRVQIERTAQPGGEGHAVGGVAAAQPVHQPHTALGVRERGGPVGDARGGGSGAGGAGARPAQQFLLERRGGGGVSGHRCPPGRRGADRCARRGARARPARRAPPPWGRRRSRRASARRRAPHGGRR